MGVSGLTRKKRPRGVGAQRSHNNISKGLIAMNKKLDKSAESSGKIAPLRNVQLFQELVNRVKDAPSHLPNWGVFSGRSGDGKTTACSHVALRTDALLFECRSTWSTGTLIQAICDELNFGPIKGSISAKETKIIGALHDFPVPLIFDEADHLVKRSLIDVIRGISDSARVPIVLIGEQHLPIKLEQFERAHNRVLSWEQTVPCVFEEAKQLLKLYSEHIEISDDLLRKIVNDTDGSTRRIVTNIERVREFANIHGLMLVDLKSYNAEIYRGKPTNHFKKLARVQA
jgi:DNA transposition AAA+ family ATPase